MKSQNEVEVTDHFSWDNPSCTKLIEFSQSTIIPFVGADYHFNGSYQWNGSPTKRKRYDSIDDVDTSPAIIPDEINLYFSSNESNPRVSIWLTKAGQSGNITITLPESRSLDASNLIKEMSKALNLADGYKDAGRTEARTNVTVEKFYSADSSINWNWIASLSNKMEVLLQGENNITCSCVPLEPSGYKYDFNKIEDWKSNLQENWGNLAEAKCIIYGDSEELSAMLDLRRNEFRLKATSSKKERTDELIDSLKEYINLPIIAGNPFRQRVEGQQNTYFTEKTINWEWFEKSYSEIFTYLAKDANYSSFSVKKVTDGAHSLTWQDKEPWFVFIHENWSNILHTHSHISTNNLNITVDCEPTHDWLSIKVEAMPQSRASEIIQDLESKLGLKRIAGNAYGVIKSSGYYSVGNWSNNGFAKAVAQAVSLIPKYSLVRAEVVEERGETERKHNTFSTYQDFAERLNKGKRYIEAHLHIKGPAGSQIGIHALDKGKRLQINSPLSPEDFSELVKFFDDELDLKKIADTKEQAESEKKSLKDSIWVLIFLPLLISVLTSTILSEQFRSAAIPKYTLQIVTPTSEDGRPIVLSSRQFEVYWKLQTERWFKKTIDINSPANYRLFGNGTIIEHKNDVRPGIKFSLPKGTYQMEIISTQTEEQRSITFTIIDSQ